MLAPMTGADAEHPRADSLPPPADSADPAGPGPALPRGCPLLLASTGGWRLDVPSRDHRCAAFVPSAPLAPEKQARLCLTDAHVTCATYLASLAAREARLGSISADRTTRWGFARTTTIIEDAGGLRARLLTIVLDRRRWPAVPAVLLVTALFTLALSGFRAGVPATPVATASPGIPTTTTTPGRSDAPAPTPTAEPAPTDAPSGAPVSAAPTAAATAAPPATSGPTFRTYVVQQGDTLSAIAAEFGTTVQAIVDLNNLSNPGQLSVGQVLRIP